MAVASAAAAASALGFEEVGVLAFGFRKWGRRPLGIVRRGYKKAGICGGGSIKKELARRNYGGGLPINYAIIAQMSVRCETTLAVGWRSRGMKRKKNFPCLVHFFYI